MYAAKERVRSTAYIQQNHELHKDFRVTETLEKMTEMCKGFPESFVAQSQLSLLIYNVLTPLGIFLAVFLNLINSFIFGNSRILRIHSLLVFVFLISIFDLFLGLSFLPKWLQNSQLARPEVAFSHLLSCFIKIADVAKDMLNAVALWFYVIVAAGYVTKSRFSQSMTYFLAFMVVLVACLLVLPQWFDFKLSQLTDLCEESSSTFWTIETSKFGESHIYESLYRWIDASVLLLLPSALIVVANLLLPLRVGLRSVFCDCSCLRTSSKDEERLQQLGKCLFIILTCVVCINTLVLLPYINALLFSHSVLPRWMSTDEEIVELVRDVVMLTRAVLPASVYFLCYGDYRQAVRRNLCCAADDHFEPCASVRLLCCKQEPIYCDLLDHARARDNFELEEKLVKLEEKRNGVFGANKWENTRELSRWV